MNDGGGQLAGRSRWGDLDRPPLDAAALAAALAGTRGPWRALTVVASTGSTNADLAEAARRGDPDGLVLVAEEQTAGRGRMSRQWVSPRQAGLTFSVLVRPRAPQNRWGWLPLLAGLATAEALEDQAGVDLRLKWPNDLLVGERKLGGLLAEQVGAAVVLGIGVNVSTRPDELPIATATSLAIEAADCTDRSTLLRAILRRLAVRLQAWDSPEADPALAEDYVARCATIGRRVRADLGAGPNTRVLAGTAIGIDPDGRLVIETTDGVEAVAAGDITHMR